MPTFSPQQSSPYRVEEGRYSPRSGSPLPPRMVPSPASSAEYSPHMQQPLNRSYDSNASSSSFDPAQSPLPEIVVSTAGDSSHSNNNSTEVCAMDNKLFADHFNLDDLSSSFRSLYKSVFQSSLSAGSSNGEPERKPMLLNSKL